MEKIAKKKRKEEEIINIYAHGEKHNIYLLLLIFLQSATKISKKKIEKKN